MPAALAARLPRLVRFGAVGVVNTLLDVALFTLLVGLLHWHVVPANILSYGAGILCSFALNSRWTFAEFGGTPGALQRFARFVASSLAAMGLSTLLVVVLALAMDPLLAKAISVVVGFLANYAMARRFVFRARG